MSDPQALTCDQIESTQKLVEKAGLSARWVVSGINGNEQDAIARYRAERVIAGGRAFSVLHDDPKVLVRLCREADARFDSMPQPINVVVGQGNTENK